MKKLLLNLLAGAALLLGGCATNNAKVAESLRVGLTKQEAHDIVAAHSFKTQDALERPLAGWPTTDSTRTNLPGRARTVEEETKTTIALAERYPLGEGAFGAEQLFLFFDPSGRLVRFYRQQVR